MNHQENQTPTYCAFVGHTRLATGSLEDVVAAGKAVHDRSPDVSVLFFDTGTGRQMEFNLDGTVEEAIVTAAASTTRKGRGRPKMGVECSELCLLPRHWEWLNAQPRSASATIRRLIEAARKSESPEDDERRRIDATATFSWAIAGDLPGFEEASRSLYRRDWDRYRAYIAAWPEDVRDQIEKMLEA